MLSSFIALEDLQGRKELEITHHADDVTGVQGVCHLSKVTQASDPKACAVLEDELGSG